MRRLARAVEGATTEAGAWKPDEAMVMREAAILVGDHSGDANYLLQEAMRTSMVVAATLCAGCEAYQSVSSRAGTISMMAKSKVRASPGQGGYRDDAAAESRSRALWQPSMTVSLL